MQTAILSRFAYSRMGTFGKLSFMSHSWFTVERPWRNNEPFVSCIPEGSYQLIPYESSRFGRTVALTGGTVSVSGFTERTAILVHAANVADDIQGCIGLGSRLGALDGKWAVLNSRISVIEFLQAVQLSTHKNIFMEIRYGRD